MILSDISNYSVIIWIAAAITASFGLIVYIGGPNRSSRVFLATVMSMASWTAAVGFFIASAYVDIATSFVKIAYFCGLLVAMSFFYFFLVYPDNRQPKVWAPLSMLAITAAFGYLFFFTDAIVAQAHPVGTLVRWGWSFGPFWWVFYLFFYPLFFGGVVQVFRTIPRLKELRDRRNLRYMIISVLVVITPPTVANIILPQFQIFDWIWLGPILSVGWISVIAYSMARFKQLDIRTFTTEILNVALIIIFFANIFSSFSGGIVGRTITFVVFSVISYYIIRLGARVDDLNRNLKSKVGEQTKEIQGLYEVEKSARVELERLNEAKDQFIMITQHHLRTPLTQIKWSLEALQSEHSADAPLAQEIHETIGSVEQINHILDNFLNISELKVGKDILNLQPASLLPLIAETLNELAPQIEAKELSVTYPAQEGAWPMILIDSGRMKEVLFIILHNAVAYNVASGSISIHPAIDGSMFRVTVSNTGLGIDLAEQKALFTEKFSRTAAAIRVHPLGMGMGLTFARYIMKAHKGTLEITSEGQGKGAQAVIQLPIAQTAVLDYAGARSPQRTVAL